MDTTRGDVPEGSVLLVNQDRWGDTRVLDVAALAVKRLNRPPADGERLDGWFVERQGRLLALFRRGDRLHYLCGRALWDVDEAQVRRRASGPLRTLTFEDAQGFVGSCRWLDWEAARRRFVPKTLDATPHADAEDFDWSLFVEAALSTGRRERVGRVS